VASNTGASQNVATVLNGSISADVTVPATGWIRIVRSVTYSSAKTDNLSILYTNSAHAASDLLFYGPQFELGPTASDYVPTTSVATFAGTPAWVTGGVNLANGSFLGASFSRQNITSMTVYCVMQWPTATAAPYSNMSLLGDVQVNNGYAGYHLDLLPAPPRCTFGGQTGYANLCNLHDGNWHLVAASSDGTTLRMFIDDVDVSDTTAAAAVFQTTILEIGNLSLTGYNFPGNIGYVSVYNVAHTSAQHAAQFAAIQGLMAAKGVALTVLPALVDFEGDSITAGLGGTTIYPTTVMAGLTPIVQGRNFAVAGNQISDLTARIATVDAQVNTARARNVLSVLIGHNDLVAGGESAATFVANLKTYCLARRAAGWNRIVLGTLLPSTVSGFNATRDAVNTLIRADTSFYDYLADYDTNPTIGADSAAANTTYYIDGTHPTTAGYGLMAPITQAAVTAALL
jgi:lysophospholipase L1-like esterase